MNPNAARPAGDPWLDGRDTPDHWDASQWRNDDLHPDMKG